MLDLEQLRRRCSDGEQFRYLFFWGHQPSKDGTITASCLSQWFAASFKIDNVSYATAEHWMMASKARLFGDDDTLQQILSAADPKTAKALGRQVKNFDNDVWTKNCCQLVTDKPLPFWRPKCVNSTSWGFIRVILLLHIAASDEKKLGNLLPVIYNCIHAPSSSQPSEFLTYLAVNFGGIGELSGQEGAFRVRQVYRNDENNSGKRGAAS